LKTIIPANVRCWEKVGEPDFLAKHYGLSLMTQLFKDPDGKQHDFSIFGAKNWATICPVTIDLKLVVVRQYKQGIDDVTIEFPAGTVDDGEGVEETAIREFHEETGYVAQQIVAPHLQLHHISTRKSANYFRTFVALGCVFSGEQKLDKDEEIEVLEVEQFEFWKMVRAGEITEPSTIVAATNAVLAGYLTTGHMGPR
jgi:ADP-ribose pyrophosphatase